MGNFVRNCKNYRRGFVKGSQEMVVSGIWFRVAMYPFRLERLVVRSVVSCLGDSSMMGLDIGDCSSGVC